MRKTISLFIATVLMLITTGMLMLYSASAPKYQDSEHFVKRQISWLILAIFVGILTSRIDYSLYCRWAIPIATITIILLILVRIPSIGTTVNGSYRWLRVGPISIQPSEFAKISVLILFSWWIARSQRRIDEFKPGIIMPFLMLGCFALPIILEPDFGTTMLISLVCIMMMFIGGVMVAPLVITGVVGLIGIGLLLLNNPERMGRILAFLDPQSYEKDEAWQLVNSLRAFAGGGLPGAGYGNSTQKYYYLPEAHTDFIFPIICEELGLIWGGVIILLFFILFVCGLRIAWTARSDFGRFMALGIVLMITLQAMINFAVVTGCLPTKGIALPFISYGGSSLIVSAAMVGILINISYASIKNTPEQEHKLFKDQVRKV